MGVGGSSAGGAIRAGAAFVELYATDNALVRGLANAEAKLKNFGKTVAGVGAAAVAGGAGILAPITGLFQAAVSRSADMARLADEFGTTTEQLSSLGYAFETVGIKQDEFADTLKGLSQKLSSAADGQDELFRRMGLNARELIGLPVDQQFGKIADALNQVPLAADRTNLSLQLFGGAGSKLNRILSQGSGELARLSGEAADVGAVLGGDTASAGAKLDKTFTRLSATVKYALLAIGEALFPQADAIEEFAKSAGRVIKTVREWVSQNKPLVMGAVAAGAALVVFGSAAVTAGGLIAGLGIVIGVVVAAFKLVVATVTGIVAAIASPLGIAVAALAGLGYLFATQTETGRTLARVVGGELSEAWGTLKDTALEAWGGILTALKRGDLQSAGEIALAGLDVAFRQGMLTLRSAWNGLQAYFVDGWTSSASAIGGVWEDLVSRLAELFVSLTAGILSRAAKVASLVGNNPLAMALQASGEDVRAVGAEVAAQRERDIAERKRALDAELKARGEAREGELDAAKESLEAAKERFADAIAYEQMLAQIESQKAVAEVAKRDNNARSTLASGVAGSFGGNYSAALAIGATLQQRSLKVGEQTRDAVERVELAIKAAPGGMFK